MTVGQEAREREETCCHYYPYQLVSLCKACRAVGGVPPLTRMHLEDAAVLPLSQQLLWLALVEQHDSQGSQPSSAPPLPLQAHLQGDGRPAFERR